MDGIDLWASRSIHDKQMPDHILIKSTRARSKRLPPKGSGSAEMNEIEAALKRAAAGIAAASHHNQTSKECWEAAKEKLLMSKDVLKENQRLRLAENASRRVEALEGACMDMCDPQQLLQAQSARWDAAASTRLLPSYRMAQEIQAFDMHDPGRVRHGQLGVTRNVPKQAIGFGEMTASASTPALHSSFSPTSPSTEDLQRALSFRKAQNELQKALRVLEQQPDGSSISSSVEALQSALHSLEMLQKKHELTSGLCSDHITGSKVRTVEGYSHRPWNPSVLGSRSQNLAQPTEVRTPQGFTIRFGQAY